jgi:hypothetical protein
VEVESEVQHGAVGRGYLSVGAGYVTKSVEASLGPLVWRRWMGNRRGEESRRRGWLREQKMVYTNKGIYGRYVDALNNL